MTNETLAKEILNSSDISDEAKIEIFKKIFTEKAQQMPTWTYPYPIQRITTGDNPFTPDPNVDWIKVTCQNWDDSGWWKQQMENARADAESILRPLAQW